MMIPVDLCFGIAAASMAQTLGDNQAKLVLP